ncbi:MAG: multicopper oxidase domain-containing protein [Opitutaceae bacterium]|nr:multicopper oxidase domain-containing protein [Opitutaceae bacterium]
MSPAHPPAAMRRCLLLALVGFAPLAAAAEPADAEPLTGETRTYFLAADEVDWNYAPAGNVLLDLQCCGEDAPWLERGPHSRPPVFKKVVFREYTDETFTTLKPRDPAWEHAGILGPIIRAEVGDRIEVTLRNHASFPVSLHAHGVHYLKAYEGAGYPDGTTDPDKDDDAIAPGDHYTYRWQVPTRAGPGPSDPSSIVWLYHSHVHSPQDVNTGLVGVLLITRHGAAREDGSPRDVDREFVTLFMNFDETASRFSLRNAGLLASDGAEDHNRFHSINGYIFGNLPMLRMRVGERVRWYLVALGDDTDLHTPHWHGNTVLHEGRRTDVVELLPASMKVADMRADNPGIWLYHCHVNDHILAGMAARYEIVK